MFPGRGRNIDNPWNSALPGIIYLLASKNKQEKSSLKKDGLRYESKS
jgi:hypothetical protein